MTWKRKERWGKQNGVFCIPGDIFSAVSDIERYDFDGRKRIGVFGGMHEETTLFQLLQLPSGVEGFITILIITLYCL